MLGIADFVYKCRVIDPRQQSLCETRFKKDPFRHLHSVVSIPQEAVTLDLIIHSVLMELGFQASLSRRFMSLSTEKR